MLFVWVVQPENSTDMATVWKNSHFTWLERLDFNITDTPLVAHYAFPMCILTSFSEDKILLSRYVGGSKNFWGLTFNVEIAPSCLNCIKCVLCSYKGQFSLCKYISKMHMCKLHDSVYFLTFLVWDHFLWSYLMKFIVRNQGRLRIVLMYLHVRL